MRYIAVDVSGGLNRADRSGDTDDADFNLTKLFEDGFAVFQDCPVGRESAKRAKEQANQEYLRNRKPEEL